MINSPSTKKPLTLGRWLLSSVGWTVGCIGGWSALYYALQIFATDGHSSYEEVVLLISFGLMNVLIWTRGFAGSWRVDNHEDPTPVWLGFIAVLWWSALAFFQVVCSVVMLLWMLFYLGSGGSGDNMFNTH
jgi:hypothetical protein